MNEEKDGGADSMTTDRIHNYPRLFFFVVKNKTIGPLSKLAPLCHSLGNCSRETTVHAVPYISPSIFQNLQRSIAELINKKGYITFFYITRV